MSIDKLFWGKQGNDDIYLFEMKADSGIRVKVSNYGGIIQSFFVKDVHGVEKDIVLGYDTLDEYKRGNNYFGATIGPIADRLALGACELAGKRTTFPINAEQDCMHSGPNGFHSRVWNWKIKDETLELSQIFHPSVYGFPGTLEVKIRYYLEETNKLRIAYEARCSKEAAVSFTNHSYFNLDGGLGDCGNYLINIYADYYAETMDEKNPVCTGRLLDVTGTPMDMRSTKVLGSILQCNQFYEVKAAGGLDHYFFVNGNGMRKHARLESRESGLALTCYSDAPGLLVYTANWLNQERGKKDNFYDKHWAVCLETESLPNAVNIPKYRNAVLLTEGNVFKTSTIFEIEQISY